MVGTMSFETNANRFYVVLVALAVVLSWKVVQPFAEALLLAAVLAGAIHPLQRRFAKRLGGRPSLSAALLTSGIVVAILGPTVAVGSVLVRDIIEGVQFVAETMQSDGVLGLVDELPEPMRDLAHNALARAPVEPEELDTALQEKVSAQQGKAADFVQRVVMATGSFLFGSAMMVIALFFLLTDGTKLVAWCERASPLEEGQTTELLREFRKVSVSVIVSSAATGLVQTAAALIGYLIASVPNPWFFAVVTFFMSFIPTIGAGGTCFFAALLLLAQGKFGMAIFLAVWGTVTVGLSDNLIKPLLAKRGMQMHGAVVFFALLGGLSAFGAIGLLLGPLIVSFLLTLVRLRNRGDEQQVVVART